MSDAGRVFVISEVPLGSCRAHAINIVKTAGGFARLGHEVTLCAMPAEGEDSSATAAEILSRFGEAGLWVETAPAHVAALSGQGAAFSRAVGKWAAELAAERGADAVYARHFAGGIESAALGLPTVMETHAPAGDLNPMLLAAIAATWGPADGTRAAGKGGRARSRALSISTISRVLRDDYVMRGADPERVFVVPDGVDVELFGRPEGGRGEPPVALSEPGPHVLYAGHLYDYKGVPAFMSAARLAPEMTWHLLGGADEDIERVESAAQDIPNLRVHGRVEHREVARWLWHADVLVLPPNADHPSARWTSPVKLGEYLASETAIVASDIPALRDWVDDQVVRWFRAPTALDHAEGELIGAVRAALGESAECSHERRRAARALAERFSYANRAAALLDIALERGAGEPRRRGARRASA